MHVPLRNQNLSPVWTRRNVVIHRNTVHMEECCSTYSFDGSYTNVQQHEIGGYRTCYGLNGAPGLKQLCIKRTEICNHNCKLLRFHLLKKMFPKFTKKKLYSEGTEDTHKIQRGEEMCPYLMITSVFAVFSHCACRCCRAPYASAVRLRAFRT